MAKILSVDENGVITLDKEAFTLERDLQTFLEKYPSIIPLNEITDDPSELVFIGREVQVSSGSIDLLYLDATGLLTVVETKLVKNPEIRRTVTGQLLEYASLLSQWTVDQIFETAATNNPNYMELLFQDVADHDDEDELRHAIEDNLKNGNLRLIVAADELNEPLRATVTFLNSHSTFEFLLLQVSSYKQSEAKKIIIPSLFGYTPKEKRATTVKPKINEEIFVQRAQDEGHSNASYLLSKAKELKLSREVQGDFINWGVSGYSYRIPWQGYPKGETVFIGYQDGGLTLWTYVIEHSQQAGRKFFDTLKTIASFSDKILELHRYKEPYFRTDTMPRDDIDEFITAVKQLGTDLELELNPIDSENKEHHLDH